MSGGHSTDASWRGEGWREGAGKGGGREGGRDGGREGGREEGGREGGRKRDSKIKFPTQSLSEVTEYLIL